MDEIRITLENFKKFQEAYLFSLVSLMKQGLKSNTPEGKEWLWNKLKEEFNKAIEE